MWKSVFQFRTKEVRSYTSCAETKTILIYIQSSMLHAEGQKLDNCYCFPVLLCIIHLISAQHFWEYIHRQTEESVKRVDRSCLAHHKLNSHKYKVLRTLYYTWRASFRTQPTVHLTQAFSGVDDAIFSLE